MRRWWTVLALLLGSACADEIPENVSAEMDAARTSTRPAEPLPAEEPDTASAEHMLQAAPPGGHADWIAEIRTGLERIPAEARLDRGHALHAVQELYTRRFEFLRQFYGPQGVTHAGDELEQSIEAAGARMQELMRNLTTDAVEITRIEQDVRTTQEALRTVEAAAQAAGLPPTAPRTP